MEAQFWLTRWASNEIGFHQPVVNPHLQRHLPALGLAPGARVFVPLCGKSLDLRWLADQGHEVVGVELSPLAIQAFFQEHGLTAAAEPRARFECWHSGPVALLCGDFFHLTPEDLAGVTAVYDRAALIALPPALRRRYADHLARLLTPGTRVLLVTVDYPPAQMDGPPFPVSEAEVRSLYGDDFTIERRATHDALEDNPRLRERGLTRLAETVWVLTRR